MSGIDETMAYNWEEDDERAARIEEELNREIERQSRQIQYEAWRRMNRHRPRRRELAGAGTEPQPEKGAK